jgi:sphinganine-1-phosphate aldolase
MQRNGLSADLVVEALRSMRELDADWRSGRTWSLVYSAGEEHDALIQSAYLEYFHENGLSPSAFPSLERMEREVVGDLLEHLGADIDEAGGTMASGGTESIILAIKAYRDATNLGDASIVVPSTAHPAFVKATEILGIRAKIVPVGPDLVADVEATEAAIDNSTIALVASAPAFPYGLIDPIPELGELALSHGVGLHVDACLGGIALPYISAMGRPVDDFDLSVPGVTSMSVDLHKYGYAAKGASAILYLDRQLRNSQFTVYTDWPGGVLASPTLLGTRPGGAIAAAWAAIRGLGSNGYMAIFESVMQTVDRLRVGIASIGDLSVIGDPPMSVFAVTSDSRDMFALADLIEERGWRIDRQTDPDSIHHIVNPRHEEVVDEYLDTLAAAYEAAPPHTESLGRKAFYGVTSGVLDSTDVREDLLADLGRRYDQ